MAKVYYNENDPYPAQWLRNLIAAGLLPDGDVDTRSIADVSGGDLEGYDQCHFFAGIGGWPLALKLAGWPTDRPVWTGSCPCQPFSVAGSRKGEADPRHLWPEFKRLIAERHPATVFGEQVAGKAGRAWLAGVRSDLENSGYAVGCADMCAAGVGAPHARQRHYWVADAAGGRWRELLPVDALQKPLPATERQEGTFWGRSGASPSLGRDQRTRLCPPTIPLLADGVSRELDGFGNAIVPPLAAQFIQAYLEIDGTTRKAS